MRRGFLAILFLCGTARAGCVDLLAFELPIRDHHDAATFPLQLAEHLPDRVLRETTIPVLEGLGRALGAFRNGQPQTAIAALFAVKNSDLRLAPSALVEIRESDFEPRSSLAQLRRNAGIPFDASAEEITRWQKPYSLFELELNTNTVRLPVLGFLERPEPTLGLREHRKRMFPVDFFLPPGMRPLDPRSAHEEVFLAHYAEGMIEEYWHWLQFNVRRDNRLFLLPLTRRFFRWLDQKIGVREMRARMTAPISSHSLRHQVWQVFEMETDVAALMLTAGIAWGDGSNPVYANTELHIDALLGSSYLHDLRGYLAGGDEAPLHALSRQLLFAFLRDEFGKDYRDVLGEFRDNARFGPWFWKPSDVPGGR